MKQSGTRVHHYHSTQIDLNCLIGMNRRKALFGLAACAVAVLLGIVVFCGRLSAPPPPLPNPNGYDDFLKAASLLSDDVGNASTLDDLRDLVSTNAESLRLVRLGLGRQCVFPTDTAMTNTSEMLSELASLKRLAQLLAAEGKLREAENNLSGAAGSYVDTIHFGNEASRGGFLITRLVGLACQAIGESSLSKLVPQLKPAEAQPVIVELEKIDSSQVTWKEVERNEWRYARYQLHGQYNPITWVVSQIGTWRARTRAKTRDKRVVAHLRLITTELALRCYQSDHGRAPNSLEQLVPKYLQRVPLDPFSGKPLVYRPQTNQWLCYSVGEDMVDDGGQPVSGGLGSKGDIFFNSRW